MEMGRVQGDLRFHLSSSNLQAIMPCVLNPCQTIGDAAGLCNRRREVAWQVSIVMRKHNANQVLCKFPSQKLEIGPKSRSYLLAFFKSVTVFGALSVYANNKM